MNQPYGYIYLIKNLQTKRVYIGQAVNINKRIKEHFYGAPKLYIDNSIKKYGPNNFTWRIIGNCYSEQKLNEAEKECIRFYQSNIHRYNKIYGYNETDGGEGTRGHKLSIQHKNAIIKSNKQRIISDETKLKISKSNTGKIRSKEFKENLKQKRIGEKHSTETKRKIGNAHKGQHHTEQSIIKIKQNRKDKCKGKNNPMYGVSMIQRLVNKYGEELGRQKYNEWKEKCKK